VLAGLHQVSSDIMLMLLGSCSDMLDCRAQGIVNVVVLIVGGESSKGSYMWDCINVDDGEWNVSHGKLEDTAR
jgi:hypothetical protein